MELRHEFEQNRRLHGTHLKFEDTTPCVYAKVRSDHSLFRKYVKKKISILEVDTEATQSVNVVRTKIVEQASHGMTHEEGGWPAQIADEITLEDTQRIRKRILKDDNFVNSVKKAAEKVNYCVNQNIAIDIYEDYFEDEANDDDLTASDTSIKEICTVLDPSLTPRAVINMSWSKTDMERIVCAYCNPTFSSTSSGENLQGYVWNILNPTKPELELVPQSQIRTVKFRKNGQEILTGLRNGTLNIFDIRAGSHPVSTSSIDCSHEESVRQADWLVTKGGFECVSVSTDGKLCFWDSRRLDSPIQSNVLRCPKLLSNPIRGAKGGVPGGGARRGGGGLNRMLLKYLSPYSHNRVKEYSGNILPGTCVAVPTTMFGKIDIITGTETGLILLCSGKSSRSEHKDNNSNSPSNNYSSKSSSSPSNKNNNTGIHKSNNNNNTIQEQMIDNIFLGHLSSVLSISRNPCFPNIFLSTGDWSTKIWSTDLPCQIASTNYGTYHTTSAMWSPTKVDTFFVTDASGTVKAWKYETMEQKSFYEKKLTSSPIVSMEMCSDGASAIVGDSKGRTMVLNLSENLCRKSQRDEKQFMNLMSKRKSTVGAQARFARRKAEAFPGSNEEHDDIAVNSDVYLAEDSHNNDPSAQRNRSSRSRSASISKDVDTLLQSFEFKKIDEEVDKFFVNLVNENLPQSVIRMYDDGKEES